MTQPTEPDDVAEQPRPQPLKLYRADPDVLLNDEDAQARGFDPDQGEDWPQPSRAAGDGPA